MSLCDACLKEVASRLRPDELSVMDVLEGLPPVGGLQREAILNDLLEDYKTKVSAYQLRAMLGRLELAGFVAFLLTGHVRQYYLTPSGQKALTLLLHE